jgi:hypothetical protein
MYVKPIVISKLMRFRYISVLRGFIQRIKCQKASKGKFATNNMNVIIRAKHEPKIIKDWADAHTK